MLLTSKLPHSCNHHQIMNISRVSNNPILISEVLGAAFTIMDDWLFMTPMFTDDSYDDDEDTWIEVDFMSALGEEEYIQKELDRVDDVLRNEIKLQTI
tara:strand:- start:61 stop:354 length:294 start_codon:yes stop_codon:yes gene_type:complete